ncbi:hypothetical protein SAMN04487890_10295 [Mucilaginibacter polytrichastri]|nr:hypothetical protein SAMN04487890_10295 [Mucilaginibacter polytrichastri]
MLKILQQRYKIITHAPVSFFHKGVHFFLVANKMIFRPFGNVVTLAMDTMISSALNWSALAVLDPLTKFVFISLKSPFQIEHDNAGFQ